MRTGDLFHIKFTTLDEKRKTGGKLVEISQAKILFNKKGGKPKHDQHHTINIEMCPGGHPSGHIRKVHIYLINEVNKKRVYL